MPRFLICLAVLLAAASATAAVHYVKADGTGDYATIADAVAAATSGDYVRLYSGVYTGSGNKGVDIDKDIILQGIPWAIIDCEGVGRAFYVENAELEMYDITIRNGHASNGGAIFAYDVATVTAIECTFLDNVADGDGGVVHAESECDITINKSICSGNVAGDDGGVVSLIYDCTGDFSLSTAIRNEAGSDGSVAFLDQGSSLNIFRAILAFNGDGAPCSDYYSANYTVSCTDVYGNRDGDWVHSIGGMNGSNGNVSLDPLFCDPMADPINVALSAGSPVGGDGTCLRMGALDIDPAWTVPVYGVDAGGTGMFATIQEALDAVPEGATLLLEDGVYTGDGNRDLIMWNIGRTVGSRSGDAAACVIDCEGSYPSVEHTGFHRIYGTDLDWTYIEYITIRNGYHWQDAGAVTLDDASFTRFIGCDFENNRSGNVGGAVKILGTGPSRERVDFQYCGFTNNTATYAGGAVYGFVWSSWIHACDFEGNTAQEGGAIYFSEASFSIQSSDLIGNTATTNGGAVYGYSGDCTVTFGTFQDNAALNGGGVAVRLADLAFSGTDFTGNVASLNGGVCDIPTDGAGTVSAFTGCIFLGNRAGGAGSVIRVDGDSQVTLASSTLHGNISDDPEPLVASQLYFRAGNTVELDHLNITGGVTGVPLMASASNLITVTSCNVWGNDAGDWTGDLAGYDAAPCNMSFDPLYCDAEAGDLSVSSDSACLPYNNDCGQIGAEDEGCSTPTDAGPAAAGSIVLRGGFPNPFNPSTTVAYELPREATVFLAVHDVAGRLVRTLRAGAVEPAGLREAVWDGLDDGGRRVGSGVYLVRLVADGDVRVERVSLIK